MIVEAIHRAREVFRRMANYAIYRITETIRVVLFVTLSIVVFNFFPVTPIQIVLLAILNDAAILTIAYDRVQPSPWPERWDLREVLTVASVLGIAGRRRVLLAGRRSPSACSTSPTPRSRRCST